MDLDDDDDVVESEDGAEGDAIEDLPEVVVKDKNAQQLTIRRSIEEILADRQRRRDLDYLLDDDFDDEDDEDDEQAAD